MPEPDMGANVGNKDFGANTTASDTGYTGGNQEQTGGSSSDDRVLSYVEDQMARAKARGINIGGSTFQNMLAAGMIQNNLLGGVGGGNDYYKNPEVQQFVQKFTPTGQYLDPSGNIAYTSPMSFANTMLQNYAGFSPYNTLQQNLLKRMIPGEKTPLGILSVVPSAMGVDKGLASVISIGNQIAGELGLGLNQETRTKPEIEEENISESYQDNMKNIQDLINEAVEKNMSPGDFLSKQSELNLNNSSFSGDGTKVASNMVFGSTNQPVSYEGGNLFKSGNVYTSGTPMSSSGKGRDNWATTTLKDMAKGISGLFDNLPRSSFRQ